MRSLAITRRVIWGFRRDRRTIALMILAPCLILTFLWLIFDGDTYRPTLAAVDLPPPVMAVLEAQNATIEVMEQGEAETALAEASIDAILGMDGMSFSVLLEGSDPSKSKAVMFVLSALGDSLGPAPGQGAGPKLERLHGNDEMSAFDNFGPVLVGLLVFFFTFLVSGVTFVQERRSGTLDRMLATPLRRHELVLGYALGFSIVVSAQATLIAAISIYGLGMMLEGSFVWLLLVTLLLAATALAIGMFVSAFARSEFQVLQFIPVVIIPQVFFSGLFPLEAMAPWLRWIGECLPLTYGARALRDIMIRGAGIGEIYPDLLVLLAFTAVCLMANVQALKQYRAI